MTRLSFDEHGMTLVEQQQFPFQKFKAFIGIEGVVEQDRWLLRRLSRDMYAALNL
jgi:hypothetical protein